MDLKFPRSVVVARPCELDRLARIARCSGAIEMAIWCQVTETSGELSAATVGKYYDDACMQKHHLG